MRTFVLTLAATALLAVSSPASAQDFGRWTAASLLGPYAKAATRVPTNAELMAAWPAAAAKKGLTGNALAWCKAALSGDLSRCRLVEERPAVNGFGDALLRLAPLYRLEPADETERPDGVDVLITASWPVPDTAPDWPTPLKPGDFAVGVSGAAARWDKPAEVLMNCQLTQLGGLRSCIVVFQDPPGLGFGAATLSFAPYMHLKPALLAGKPMPVGITFPFHYGARRH